MASGAMISTLVALGTMPIISRIFDKDDFGVYAVFVSVTSLVGMFATAFYPTAFVIPKFKVDFLKLLKASIFGMLITTTVVCIAILLFKETFVRSFNLGNIQTYIWLLPIGIIFSESFKIIQNWNVRNAKFNKNASSNVSMKLSERVLNIFTGTVYAPSPGSLIYSYLVSLSVGISFLYQKRMFTEFKAALQLPLKQVFHTCREYIKYPLFVMPANFINKFTSDLPLYFLALYFSASITGGFSFALTLLNVPFKIIGNSLASVFYHKAAQIHLENPSTLSEFTINLHLKMLIVGSIVFGVIFAFGEFLFSFVFGTEWALAGKFASLLSIYYIYRVISSPLSKIFSITRNEQYTLWINITLAVSRTISIYFGVLTEDPLTAVLYFSVGNLIGYFITNLLVFYILKANLVKIVLTDIAIILCSFAFFYYLNLWFIKI
jgi:O-antigen/teichoic acid export membrane protein